MQQSALAATILGICTLFPMPLAAQDSTGWDDENAIRAEAKIEIKDQMDIAAEVPGRLVELNPADVGKTVKPGQVVVKIDSSVLEAELKEAILAAEEVVLIEFAEVKLKHAKNELQDKLDRNAKGGSKYKTFSETEIRRLELDVEQADAELRKAKYTQLKAQQTVETKRVQLEQYSMKAAIGGIVTDLHYRCLGSSVRQGDPIMTIVNLDEVLVYLEVTPDEYDRIQIGDDVLVRRTSRTQSDVDPGAGEDGGLFKSTARPGTHRSTASMPRNRLEEVTFKGKVTHFSNTAKTNKENTIYAVAVVQNQLAGPGKYLLREGSFIKAVILPQ
jgi:multidrug efflux pump subunit AcrA (membrane-fusion protein)